jgi:hypothetical protein
MRQLIISTSLLLSLAARSQTNDSLATKLFFESGFSKTKVVVIGSADTLLSKALTTNYRIGYAQILSIRVPYKSITIKVGNTTRKIQLKPNKFYTILLRDNELYVDELNEEPLYR